MDANACATGCIKLNDETAQINANIYIIALVTLFTCALLELFVYYLMMALKNRLMIKRKPFFCESIGNPAGNIVDIQRLAEIARKHGVPVIVSSTNRSSDK